LSSSCAIAAVCASASTRPRQAFSTAKSSAVDYTKADLEPKGDVRQPRPASRAARIADLQVQSIPASGATPAHCRVNGVISPEIGFQVNLPAKWNGRFYMIGNGGHAGQGPEEAGRTNERAVALQNGFAFATTNTGHDGQKEPGATFVLSNPQKAIDYAYRAVHMTAATQDDRQRVLREAGVVLVLELVLERRTSGMIEAQRFPRTSMASWPTRPGSIRPASRSARCGISAR
jgi:feruloyl esterase